MVNYLKMFLKWALVLTIAFHIGPLLIWLFGLIGYLNVGNSYISYVNTPSYEHTSEQLAELNLKGYGEVVRLKGGRPIYILEGNLNKIKRYKTNDTGHKYPYSILGVTWALPAYCLIIMDTNIDEDEYKLVLWHEYLHCFYYGHNDTPGDIMAPMAGNTDLESVNNYLKELKEIYD